MNGLVSGSDGLAWGNGVSGLVGGSDGLAWGNGVSGLVSGSDALYLFSPIFSRNFHHE